MSVPVATIIGHVLVNGLAVYASGQPIKQADAQTVLDAINGVLDDWSANPQASVTGVISAFTTTGVQPVPIGPAGTWVLPVRPVKIDGLAVALSSGIYTPITVHDDPQWWLAQTSLTVGSQTDAYYAPDVPTGSLYFASLPAAGLAVRLLTRWALGAVTQTASLVLPPGYQTALEYTAMERVCDAFHVVLTANQTRLAGQARALIFGNNLRVPSLSAAGLGLPSLSTGWWDYTTGQMRTR